MYFAALILSAILYHNLESTLGDSTSQTRQVVVEANDTQPGAEAL